VELSYLSCRRFCEGAQGQAHWVDFSPGSGSLSYSVPSRVRSMRSNECLVLSDSDWLLSDYSLVT
jgi:hypothetical protein